MKVFQLTSFLLVTVLVHWNSLPVSSVEPNPDLQGIILIVQSGITAINGSYPNDLYANENYWPDGYGQLTIDGKQQMYKLGQAIKEHYGAFLPANPREIFIQSFDNDPCFESAETLSAGAFPPSDRWNWSEELNWQPIHIHSNPSSQDTILGTSYPCPILSSRADYLQTTEAFKQIKDSHADLLSYVAENAGFDGLNITDFLHLYENIILEEKNRMPMLSWINQTLFEEFTQVIHDLTYLLYSDPLVERIVGGPLISQISEDAETIQAKKGFKVYIYVTNQEKILSVLSALVLNNTQEILPKPGSVIGLEIFGNAEKGPHFNLTFNDGDDYAKWTPLIMFGCDYDCPMDHFYRSGQIYSPTNVTELCAIPPEVVNRPSTEGPVQGDEKNEIIVGPSLPELSPESHDSGSGLNAFLVTVLCFVSALVVLLGISMVLNRKQRGEYVQV